MTYTKKYTRNDRCRKCRKTRKNRCKKTRKNECRKNVSKKTRKIGGAPKKSESQRRKELLDKDFQLAIIEQKIDNQKEVLELIKLFSRNPGSPRHNEYEEKKKVELKTLKELIKKNKDLLKGYNYRADRIKSM